ncbi:MAG: AMP-binding acetyl-CoA synthetase, partial [Rubrivivax sp.]|nr:AMP-binding acetyl-CoA synthetase [Rubrivivax sp.]
VMLSAEAAARAADAAARAELEASLAAHLRRVNDELDPHERLDCLVVVTTPWTVDNDFVTPTFKVKRNRVEQAYGAHYERWAGAGREVVWLAA